MLENLDPNARTLAEYMSQLSEQAWSARWMHGLEFELWKAVVDGPRTYGLLLISQEHIDRLRILSASARGWIVFDDISEETLIGLAEWKTRFANASSG